MLQFLTEIEVGLIAGVIAFVLGVVFSTKIIDTIKGVPTDLRTALKTVEVDAIAKIAAAKATTIATLPVVVAAKTVAPAPVKTTFASGGLVKGPSAADPFVKTALPPSAAASPVPSPAAEGKTALAPAAFAGAAPVEKTALAPSDVAVSEKVALAPGSSGAAPAPNANAATPTIVGGPGPGPAVV